MTARRDFRAASSQSSPQRRKEELLAWHLERDDFIFESSSRSSIWRSMIFSENRYPLFGIML